MYRDAFKQPNNINILKSFKKCFYNTKAEINSERTKNKR